MRTMEESIEQKAQERADRKLQYIISRYGMRTENAANHITESS